MERRVKTKIEKYQVSFKESIKDWLNENDYVISKDQQDKTSEFLKFLYDFNGLELTKEDFQKRKRVKNPVSHFERCTAKRANGEQCTRRKKENSCFCGTHVKGTPHGSMDNCNGNDAPVKKIEVWVEEIKGINYYIDSNKNVYSPEDIVANKPMPSIIAKWQVDEEGNYEIPTFDV